MVQHELHLILLYFLYVELTGKLFSCVKHALKMSKNKTFLETFAVWNQLEHESCAGKSRHHPNNKICEINYFFINIRISRSYFKVCPCVALLKT